LPTPAAKKEEPKFTVDSTLGEKKIAALWGEIEVSQLEAITKSWKNEDLARVMAKMDSAKVAEWLAAMKPDRASAISKIIE
ncbi:hypothetical protein, partial [Staphylococcus aureus]